MTGPEQPFHGHAVEIDLLTRATRTADALIKQAGVPAGLDGPWFTPDGSSIGIDNDPYYFLTKTTAGYIVQIRERDEVDTVAEFGRFDEAYKYLLWIIWDAARSGNRLETKDMSWYREGPDPDVTISGEGNGYRLVLQDDPGSECIVHSKYTAIPFTHVMVRTPEQLEAVMREGLPEFTD